MKKGLFAFVFAAILSVLMVTPAFAADLNSYEQKAFDRGMEVVHKWGDKGVLYSSDVENYEQQSRSALAKVDLSEAACNDFIAVINEIDAYLDNQGVTSATPGKSYQNTILGMMNKVANKYNFNVVATGNHAQVRVDYTDKATGKTTTVASTGKTVKQTGFGLEQTAIVAAASVAVLAGAFFVARKKQLFQ